MFKKLKLQGFLLSSLLLLLLLSLTSLVTGMTIYKNYVVYQRVVKTTNEESANSDQYLFDTFFNVLLYKNAIFNDKNIIDFKYSDDKETFLTNLHKEYDANDSLYFDVALQDEDNTLYPLKGKTRVNDLLDLAPLPLDGTTLCIAGKTIINDHFVLVLGMNQGGLNFYFFIKEEALSPLFLPSHTRAFNIVGTNEEIFISTNNDIYSFQYSGKTNSDNVKIAGERYIVIKHDLEASAHFSSLHVISFIPYASLYGVLDIILVVMIIFLVGVFSLVGYLSYKNVGKIVKPIEELSEKMSKYKKVEDVSERTNNNNEVFELEASFNEMVDRIDALIAKQEEDSEAKRKLELESLQTQINPHFLYNALDSIAWMSKISQNKDIEEFIILLAKFYRLSLHKGAKHVTLAEEMDIVRFYLSIHSRMFPNLFTYEINYDEAIKDVKTLKLILQPLVENAIKYAFHSYDVRGKIIVSAYDEEEYIKYVVSDNGRGFDLKTLNINKKEQRGFGIKNIRERLSLEYEGKATFIIESKINKGTTITITIPKMF